MPALDEVKANLQRIDWDFPRTGTRARSIHTTHWFPGNFIPQIPSALIQILSEQGNLVCDPFAGSGTTGLEAWRLGRQAILNDRLSPCVLVMKGKIALASGALSSTDLNRLLNELAWTSKCLSDRIGKQGEGGDLALSGWLSQTTQSQLRYIWGLIEQEEAKLAAALKLLFSDVLFACASSGGALTGTGGRRRHHWGWVADNVRPKVLVDHDAIALFTGRLIAAAQMETFRPTGPIVIQGDARQLPTKDEQADVIVTSPPYIGMIDYARANRLLYSWMGWSLDDERSGEIGARYKRERRNMVEDYVKEMNACWSEMARTLKPGGYCAVIIGESRKFSGVAVNAMEGLASHMQLVWGPVTRVPTRRRVSDRDASATTEQIFVYRKP